MAWIRTIEEHEAEGPLKEAYDRVKGKRGKVANILKIHSLLPETMTAHLDLYMKILYAPGPLSRRQRELVATVVSAANGCAYCTRHHGEALAAYAKDRDWVERIMVDYTRVELDASERALLDYAVKLTQHPERMDESDVDALRAAGFDDQTILLVNLIAGYFNFVNRVAVGLGVPFSEAEVKGYKY